MTTAPPKATKTAGRRLWKSIMDDYDLSGAELEILRQAVRVADVLDDLAAIVAAEGVIENGTGRARPAVVEQRQESIALARLLASLRLPDSAESARTQTRVHVASMSFVARREPTPRRPGPSCSMLAAIDKIALTRASWISRS